jgi:hypothetical protein
MYWSLAGFVVANSTWQSGSAWWVLAAPIVALPALVAYWREARA